MAQLFAGVGGLHEIFPMDTLHGIPAMHLIAPGTPPGNRVHTLPFDWPEGESLWVPIYPSSLTNCRP